VQIGHPAIPACRSATYARFCTPERGSGRLERQKRVRNARVALARLRRVAQSAFDEWIAEHYEALWPEVFDPAVLDPTVDLLADLAGDGAALEFAIGTGRVAIPLSRRGVPVHGIELSPAMAARLAEQPDAAEIGVTVGDYATTTVDGPFTLVYLVANTITNLTTQAEQVLAFANAARHLQPGGCFLVENYVPELRRLPPGESRYVFAATPTHVGVSEYDFTAQIDVSHHWWTLDGQLRAWSSTHRYVWPSELDLMARFAGLDLVDRWSDWRRSAFTGESRRHVSVWQRDGASAT
jgi:SAM-dependent methyltransferase